MFPTVGGGRVSSIAFNERLIELEIGQSKEITASMVTVSPKYAADKSFYIVSDDDAVVSVTGDRTLNGIGYGQATVTVVSTANEQVRGTAIVRVNYASDVSMTLTTQGGTVTDSGIVIASTEQSERIEMACSLSAGADPSMQATWSVNGATVESSALTYMYDTPTTPGEYTVTCTLDNDLCQSVAVRVFDPFMSTPESTAVGTLEQTDNYTPVMLSGITDLPADNPQPVCDWYINGRYTGTGQYVFVPQQAGEYIITCKINGIAAAVNGADYAVVRAYGSLTPTNLFVDYDNCYPNVYVRWDDPGVLLDYEVKVNGKTYRSTNRADRDLFSDATFDASKIVDIFAGAEISVRSLGDDGLYTESETATAVTLEAVPTAARAYLSERFYDGARNYYIVDDAEFNEAYAAMLLFRRDESNVSMKTFIAYDPGKTAMDMARRASNMSQFTGSYFISAEATAVSKNSEVSVSVRCATVNRPSAYTGAGGQNDRNAALNALRPHVNYDEEKQRAADYRFPIDDIAQSVKVQTSEELYYVAECGFRPVPDSGSSADRIYRAARSALLSIITEDMTDVEKAHAIYDYVMWKVVYDNEVLRIGSTEQSVKYAAYYLEGVFGTREAPFAVCDGIAKAYSLLCNIEGLPCVRIAGTAYTGGGWGGHAWNKVCVDGAWYNVDCTWGDYTMGLRNNRGQIVYREMATHEYFLKTDAEFALDHREDTPNDFPRSTDVVYNVYNEKIAFNGGNVDFYIMSTGAALRDELNTLVDYTVSVIPKSSFTIGTTVTVTGYFGIEIRIADSLAASVEADNIGTIVNARLKAHNVRGSFLETTGGGIILITL